MTGGRCSLLVRAPPPLSVNATLHSLVGAGVSLDRDAPAGSSMVGAGVSLDRDAPAGSSMVGAGVSLDRDAPARSSMMARCPLELVIEDASRRHASPLCALRQRRQRHVYQSHDSQIRLYFTHRRRDEAAPSVRHRHVQPPPPRQKHHRAAFIVKLEGK